MKLPLGFMGGLAPFAQRKARATDVVTASTDGVRVVKGADATSLTRWLEQAQAAGRVLAFQG